MDEQSFISRCRDIAPVLAEHASQGESIRKVPDQVYEAVLDARLLPAVVPPSLGGHGLGLNALCQGTRELARGCPASAWAMSFLMLHAWMMTRFPAEGRDEFFAGGTLPRAAAPLAPTGRLTPTAGGFRVTGRWEWATSIAHSNWVMVHGIDETAEIATRFAALPIEQVTIEDVWFTSGMRATGSNAVVIDDVFVPETRTCTGVDIQQAGAGVDDDQLQQLPLASVLSLIASAPAVGAAEAGLELYAERLAERVLAYSLGDRAADEPVSRSRLAAVMSDVTTMRSAWDAAIAEIERRSSEEAPTDLARVQCRLAAAAAVRSSRQVLGAIGEGAGASVYACSHPHQRLQRDVETLKGHAIFDWDRTTELAGRVMLGGALRLTDLA